MLTDHSDAPVWLGQSAEMSKLRLIAKDKERAAEASQRVHGLNESFSRDSERKLTERMEAIAGNRSGQVKALQDRLREHVRLSSLVVTVSFLGTYFYSLFVYKALETM